MRGRIKYRVMFRTSGGCKHEHQIYFVDRIGSFLFSCQYHYAAWFGFSSAYGIFMDHTDGRRDRCHTMLLCSMAIGKRRKAADIVHNGCCFCASRHCCSCDLRCLPGRFSDRNVHRNIHHNDCFYRLWIDALDNQQIPEKAFELNLLRKITLEFGGGI